MVVKATVHIAEDKETPFVVSKAPKLPRSTPEIKAEIDKLEKLTQETESVIYEVSAVFPFQLFPDKLIVDKNKITVVRKDLLMKRIYPVLIEDVITVKVQRGPIFASIDLEVRGFEINPTPLNFVWPEHASKAEKYIMGLIKAKREGIDLTKLTVAQIKKRLAQIGGTTEEVKNLF